MPRKKTKRSDARYEIKRKMPDGTTKHFYGASVTEATLKYEEERQRIIDAQRKTSGGATYREMAVAYEAYITAPGSHIKRGTINAYKKHLPVQIDYFGDTPMADIDAQSVTGYLERLKVDGKALHTITNARSVLSCVFRFWCANYHGTGNPVQYAEIPAGLKRGKRDEPTAAQRDLINAHPEGCGFWAQLFEYTGLRLGEANALRWDDVDLNAGKIHVERAMPWDHNQPYLETPKSDMAYRDIPILAPLRPALEEGKRAHKSTEYVLSGTDKPLTQSQYEYRWKMYCRPLGLCKSHVRTVTIKGTPYRPEHVVNKTFWEAPDVTAHQFRHFYGTNLYYAKIPDKLAQKLLGHADITTTRRFYQELRDAEDEQYIDELNRYVVEQKSKVVKKSSK